SRWAISVPSRRRRNRADRLQSRSCAQEKRAACNGKRPKSREETPKEGSDSARRYRTAAICNCDAQSARAIVTFPMLISLDCQKSNSPGMQGILFYFKYLG